jgi:predicted glycosyltransferase
LFIVDKEPLGLRKEVLPTLRWLNENLPETKNILGLRDIMDEASVTRKDWLEKDVYRVMEELYDEIWVYGRQEFYDPIEEYAMGERVRDKITFTGYIPRRVPNRKTAAKIRRKANKNNGRKLVVATAGGGGDGYSMMHNYLTMLEQVGDSLPIISVVVTGPFMPRDKRDEIIERARKIGVRTWTFYGQMEEMLAAADLVISMGGYNTVCEMLSVRSPSLIIPRERPRKEQLIRAQILKKHNLVDYLPWAELTPEALKIKIIENLQNSEKYVQAMQGFDLTGLQVMSQRLAAFRGQGW